MIKELTSADPRRYASADVLIFASDWRRGPDAFTGSPVVFWTEVADFFVCAQLNKVKNRLTTVKHYHHNHRLHSNDHQSAQVMLGQPVLPWSSSSTCSGTTLRAVCDTRVFGPDALHITQPTVLWRWRKIKALTTTTEQSPNDLIHSSSTNGLPRQSNAPFFTSLMPIPY